MQRIALACLGVALLAGCAAPPAPRPVPLPAPLLETRAPRTAPPPPAALPVVTSSAAPRAGRARTVDVEAAGLRPGRWDVIVIHHSAQAVSTPASMDRYHREVRHWENGLGYHFVIGNGVNVSDGELHVGNRWRRQETGAHCKTGSGRFFGQSCPDNYFNERGVGICLIGDFERDQPTAAQMRTLVDLICTLCDTLEIRPSRVYGHGEVTGRTLCPGRFLDMAGLRHAVQQRLGGP